MMINYIITALFLIILDIFWFSWSMSNVYQFTFTEIQGAPLLLKISGGIVAWILIASGLNYFAIVKEDILGSSIRGALFGLIVYGVYNATNYATFNKYHISTAIIDTMWGTFASGIVSAAVAFI